MNAVTRKLNNVAKTLASGLLVALSLTANAAEPSATATTVALIGQMEVTAPSELANLGSMEVTAKTLHTAVADLGSMTVTAPRETAVALRVKAVESAGETESARARSPRAVLVQ